MMTEYKKIRRQAALTSFLLDHYYHEDGTRRSEDEYEAKLGYKSIARDIIGGEKLMLRRKELLEKWKSLTAKQKEPYREKSRKALVEQEKAYELAVKPKHWNRTRLPRPPPRFDCAYAFFLSKNCVIGVPAHVQSKTLSALWKSFSDVEKQIYQDAYAEHLAIDGEPYKTFLEGLTPQERTLITEYKKIRPQNAFSLFLLDHYYHEDGTKRTEDEYEAKLGYKSIARDVIGGKKLLLRSKELREKWKSLTAEQKEPYREKSRKALVERAKAHELALKPMHWNRSRLPRPSPEFTCAYTFFVSKNSVIGVQVPIQIKRLSALWESLSDVEKQIYQDAYAEHLAIDGERYKTFLEGLTPQERILITEYKKIRPQNALTLFLLDHYYHEDGTRRTEDEYEAKLGYKSIARDVIGGEKLMLRRKELREKWKSLTAEQKELYREKSRKTLIRRGKYKSIEMVTVKPQPHPSKAWMLLFQDHYFHEDGTRRTEDEYEAKLGHKSIARDVIGFEKLHLRRKELGEKWKSLTAEQKELYQEKSRKALMERVEAYV